MTRKHVAGILRVFGAVSVMLFAEAGEAYPQQDTRDTGARQAHPLEPGDAIRISAWRDEELEGEYPINENGAAVLPLLGLRQVAGVRPLDLERRLKGEYAEQLRNQEVDVVFLRRVSVLGSVGEPGLYMLDPTMRLSDALALAGGAQPDGRPQDTKVYRSRVEITDSIDLTRPLAGQLSSGDEIRVPRSSWLSRNGLVLGASMVSAVAILISATLN